MATRHLAIIAVTRCGSTWPGLQPSGQSASTLEVTVSATYPKLTSASVLLADARNVVSGVDTLKGRAKLILAGLEAELSFVVEHRELGSEPPAVLVDRHRQPSPRDLAEFTDAAATPAPTARHTS